MRILKWAAICLGILIAVYLGGIFVYHGPTAAWRILVNRQPTTDTYQIFPQRQISPAQAPWNIRTNTRQKLPQKIKFSHIGGKMSTTLPRLLAETKTRAFIVIQKNRIIHEEYLRGATRATIVTAFSVTKSFVSTLIGIAIAEGKIKSADDAVINYLPEITGHGLDGMTIRDLMKMSSGIPYAQDGDVFPLLVPFSDDARTYYANDFQKLGLAVSAGKEAPHRYFRYNDYHLILEALILSRATGMTLSRYLEEKLWKPAGMEYSASWSLDREGGLEHAHAGLNARPIDFARFGLLMLNDGVVQGKRIISSEWIRQATEPEIPDRREWKSFPRWVEVGGYYGLHWWGIKNRDDSYDYMARGNLGQIIYISPEKQVVVVRFGDGPRPDRIWPFAIRALIAQLPE